MSKKINPKIIDDIFDGIDLPSNDQVRRELGNYRISEGGKRAYQDPARLEKQRKAMQNRDNSSHKQAGQKRANSPEWKKNQKEGVKKLKDNAEYRENYLKGNAAKYNNAEYWENYYNAIKKRDADKEYHKRRIAASNAKIAIKVVTPAGEFDSISDAARHYGMTSEGMRNRVNSDKYPEFYKTSDVAKKPQKKKK